MLKYLLKDHIDYPLLGNILNYGVYYPIILIAAVVGVVLVYRRLNRFDYEEKRLRQFILILAVSLYPAIIIGARFSNMFYYPLHMWTPRFFVEQFVSGKFTTFHGGLIFTTVLFAIITLAMKFRFWQVFDTFFLYIPLGHAIGRVSCLLVGCCWGRELHLTLFGSELSFRNPVPAYAIILNLLIFYFLRWVYVQIHERGYEQYSGMVVALYLILYSNARIFMEAMRIELTVAWGLTQAQLVMAGFILLGGLIYFQRASEHRLQEEFTGSVEDRKTAFQSTMFFLTTLAVFYLIGYIAITGRFVQWPFRELTSFADSAGAILVYSPFMAFALASLYWLKRAGLSITAPFRWKKFSWTVIPGIVVSAGYALFLLSRINFGIDGGMLWIPILVLSIMNAFAEEIMFRLVLYRLLKVHLNNRFTANLVQSICYAVVHLFIGGPVLALLSICYGLLMGVIMDRNESIVPALLCHFIIDLGVIGFPIIGM